MQEFIKGSYENNIRKPTSKHACTNEQHKLIEIEQQKVYNNVWSKIIGIL